MYGKQGEMCVCVCVCAVIDRHLHRHEGHLEVTAELFVFPRFLQALAKLLELLEIRATAFPFASFLGAPIQSALLPKLRKLEENILLILRIFFHPQVIVRVLS